MVGMLMVLISIAKDNGSLPLDFWLFKKLKAPTEPFPMSTYLQGKFVFHMSMLSSFYES